MHRRAPTADLVALLEAVRAAVEADAVRPAPATPGDLGPAGLSLARASGTARATSDEWLVRYDPLRPAIADAFARLAPLVRHWAELPPSAPLRPSGRCLYGAGGYMGWHSNADVPGLRIYFIHSERGGLNFFRYCGPDGAPITDWEEAGWIGRLFEAPAAPPFWHCVGAGCRRLSVGFRVA